MIKNIILLAFDLVIRDKEQIDNVNVLKNEKQD
jgi:hypothetical protein